MAAALRNDFAARVEWCVRPHPGHANHPPAAVLNGDRTGGVLRLRPVAGSEVRLTARGSRDPDGDRLAFSWFHYPEPGGQDSPLDLGAATGKELRFTAPAVNTPTGIHIVLEARDEGTPPLTATGGRS